MDTRKVLLVEDHADDRLALRRFLEIEGYHVAEAATMNDGIAKIDGQHYALLDLHLPDGDGINICEQIRKLAPQTKVAFVTSAFDPEYTIRVAGQCPDAIFKKPINPDEVLRWLRSGGKSHTA